MRIAVSGVGGFVGVHLVRELVVHSHDVLGLGKGPVPAAIVDDLVSYVDQDLALAWPDQDVDAVVHLAGLSAVGPSFAEPQRYLEGNSAPVTHLFEGLLARGRSPRVLVISTGAVYPPGIDIDETWPTQASSPYAVSKLLVEQQCAYYRRRGIDVVVMRPFNHIGPGQQNGFLLPDLVTGLLRRDLVVGDLDTRRDYTDVRDVARAYRLAAEAPRVDAPVLNVCSGRSVSGRELLDVAVRALGVTAPEVRVDLARLRPDDPREIRGDNALIDDVLDWTPAISLEQTVADTVGSRGV